MRKWCRGLFWVGLCSGGMRSRQQIEAELNEKRSMLGRSQDLDANVKPYVQALEWVLSGDADQIGAVRVTEWNDFDAAILCARTSDDKMFVSEEVPQEGIYSLLRYERVTDT